MVARYPVEVAMTENPNYIGDGSLRLLDGCGIELRLKRHDAPRLLGCHSSEPTTGILAT